MPVTRSTYYAFVRELRKTGWSVYVGDGAPSTFVSPASRGPRRVFFDLDEVRAFLRLNPELPGDDMVVGPPLMIHEPGADATLRWGKWVLDE